MLDATLTSDRLQRARGEAWVTLRQGGKIGRLAQSGSAKLFLPRVHTPVPEIVFLNTAGGLTGGDRMAFGVEIDAGGRAVATTQTAERAYHSLSGAARLDVNLAVGREAAMDWLPQETILYDGSALRRRTRVNLAPAAQFLMAEMLVLGRAAMGETVTRLAVSDQREIWRGTDPVMIEPLHVTDATLAPRPALLGGARAIATIVLVVDGAEDALGSVRETLRALPDADGAASAWDGRCVVRLRAADGWPLRRAAARGLRPC